MARPIAADAANVAFKLRGAVRRGGSRSRGSESRLDRNDNVTEKAAVLSAEETPLLELEELRTLIAEGQERGYLTFEEISGCLEEVEVTKEQIQDLHAHLEEHGIDVIEADGRPGAAAEGERPRALSVPSHGRRPSARKST